MRRVVIFRHGILINRFLMKRLEWLFRSRGYKVHNRSYPTTRKTIKEHAVDLFDELRAVQEFEEQTGGPYELYVVTHSLGGLVFRYALTHFPVPTIRRAVQLVPPNQGSTTARWFNNLPLPIYRWIAGKSGAQLAEAPPGIFEKCGVPDNVEIGIVAGVNGIKLLLPIPLPKPHDGIVTLDETRLGDFPVKELPFNHTPILWRRRTFEEAAYFLENGEFR